ncbi:MAG: helix-turn-helix domain-containing protein [Actinobacteria bacterium]|nr:helix-turn-helix domain-containing protein [Actinomycetota bacterium]MTA63884.1 helix-turn-helix domain-containing protein [Actinomycetota bacterium]
MEVLTCTGYTLEGSKVVIVNTADITWLNTGESARRLGITPRTLYRFIDDGKVPAYRFGRVIRLKESEVAQFIEECRIAPGTLDISSLDPEDQEAEASKPSK